jgi:hypothetical protein
VFRSFLTSMFEFILNLKYFAFSELRIPVFRDVRISGLGGLL